MALSPALPVPRMADVEFECTVDAGEYGEMLICGAIR